MIFQSSYKYTILVLMMLGLWTIGFVSLAGRIGEEGQLLVLNSLRYFMFVLFYASGFLFWLGLLVWPASRIWVQRLINAIQSRAWLALIVLAGLVAAALILPRTRFSTGTGLFMSAMIALFILIGLVLIFADWRKNAQVQFWRKGVVALVSILVAVEVIAQGLAAFGLLPGKHSIAGLYVPHGRVYYTEEGLGNGVTNNFGWYYPDFRLAENSRRVLVIGDSFIQALQVDRQQNAGVRLEQLINQNDDGANTEVITLGMPGFGPGLYISLTRLDHAIELFEPDEIVVFFNLGSDFQTADGPSGYDLFFELREGNAVIHDESYNYQHDLKHLILDGYEPEFNPVLTLYSHYLTPKIVGGWLSNEAKADDLSDPVDEFDIPGFTGVVLNTTVLDSSHNKITEIDLATTPGKNNIVFEKETGEKAANALMIAQSLLELSSDFAEAKGVNFRVVTIPAFPKAFYTQDPTDAWKTEIGNYDLLLPERVLQTFAQEQGIPFLAMGQYMKESGLSIDEIKRLYFLEGRGHFTPEGHGYFAEAVYSCFIDRKTPVKEMSCSID